ncbi:metal-dependent hydrolase [Sneathiella limimaris]|uniref:metal-dependent hydrolase n=1 Tax=Sneathiella limimaris TaxID=1964213 RepID=UPI00146F0391|nr:metal-dependent hydrolase [Sneathiella limimaris]
MDSVTQFVLGASIGAACLGKRHGLRKAALTGGLLGTLPDLDVFWDYGGALENFVQHRSATHSLLVQTIVTPFIAEGLWRLFKKPDGGGRLAFYWTVWLTLITHALLDATTIYGTQLLWPITDYPFGIGSMFIIDPLYTLPLLFVTLWALIRPNWSPKFRSTLGAALILSTCYLGWSMIAQGWMKDRAVQQFADRGIPSEDVLIIPLPFTTFAWKAVAIQPETYANLYLPLLHSEDPPVFYSHKRWPQDLSCAELVTYPAHTLLEAFTKGFYSLTHREDGNLVQADLRMGLTPNYVFQFALQSEAKNDEKVPSLAHRVASTRSQEGDFPWLLDLIRGDISTRPAEKEQLLPAQQVVQAQLPRSCSGTG